MVPLKGKRKGCVEEAPYGDLKVILEWNAFVRFSGTPCLGVRGGCGWVSVSAMLGGFHSFAIVRLPEPFCEGNLNFLLTY